MCQIFEVSRSTYYAWCNRPISLHEQKDEMLVMEIRLIFKESRQTYGHRRIKKALRKKGIKCSNRRVARLMREHGMISRLKRRFKATTNSKHNYPITPNLLAKDFQSKMPNKKWVGDITYIPTDEGWLYLAAVEDLFTRKVVGWALDSRMTKQLTINAVDQAITKERPSEGLIFHSDRGSQYAAYAYQDKLVAHSIRQSMSSKGDCYDNASMESFFATLKKDLIHGRRFRTRAEAKLAVIDYIETWYNSKRLHSSLDYMSPMEFERQYRRSQAA